LNPQAGRSIFPSGATPHLRGPAIFGFSQYERPHNKVISRFAFARRMAIAMGLWACITLLGLAIGMAGYALTEGMSFADAYVNAAMILSGMGPVGELHTTAGKIFAGSYAILSGLIIILAASFILAPIFHRLLHCFHVETGRKQD
jgi:hypothetical protein